MTAERWQRIKGIAADALELEPGARREFIASACDQDADILNEVLLLVSEVERTGDDFLSSPPWTPRSFLNH
jgi:hypothetical protein